MMQEILNELIWVALGGIFGGTARYFVSGLVARHIGETFPWGTIIVNLTGAFAIGFIAAAGAQYTWFQQSASWFFAVTGFLGSYTTVSSFSWQTLALAHDGELHLAAANVVLSLALCLAAVTLGFAAGVVA